VTFAPPVLKECKNHRNSPILQYLHFQITTDNAQSYCLTFIHYCSLETILVTFLFLLLWNYPLIPWHTTTTIQSHVQIVQGIHTCFSNE